MLVFKKWMGASRFVYNRAVELLRHPDTIANWYSVRKDVLSDLPEWCAGVPYQVKSFAVKDACLAVRKAKLDCRTKGKYCQVKFRAKKDSRQSIGIPGSAISSKGIYHTLSGGGLRFTEPLPSKRVGSKSESKEETYSDSRIVLEYGRWWLCCPERVVIAPSENQGRLVAIDPGVRTFATFFSPNEFGKIGSGDYSRLLRLGHHLDKLLSRINRKDERVSSKVRMRLKKAADRIRFKMKCLVDEIHWKTIRFLVDNFDTILLPFYQTGRMLSKAHRKIGRESVRSMLTWSFYKFSERLRMKAESMGKKVVRLSEAYTTRTASWSGEIKSVGGSRMIKSQGLIVDRDLNGARGIFLRALVDTPCLVDRPDCVVSFC